MPIILSPGVSNPTPPTSATSSDGKLTVYADTDHAGMLLRADFSALSTKTIKVRFYRGSTVVRSGDPAWAPGGMAVAYDHEAPLGSSGAWTAVPIFADGSTGTSTTAASLTVPSMGDDVDCWVKPINNPGRSVAYQVHTNQIQPGGSGRVQSYAVPGRTNPIGTYDVRTPKEVSITLRTNTKAEKDALNDALDLGPVLVQLRESYGIDDFYAIPTDTTETYFVGMYSQIRDIPTGFIPVDRPPTIDSPLYIPGRSWDEQLAAAPTWNDRLTVWPTWDNALGLP